MSSSDKKNTGFSGFESLVSNVDDDLAKVKSLEKKSVNNRVTSIDNESEPGSSQPHERVYRDESKANSRRFLFVIGGIIFFVYLVSIINNSGSSPQAEYQVAANDAAPASGLDDAAPAAQSAEPNPYLQDVPSTPAEAKPPIGTGMLLTREQLHYCLAETVRLDAMKNVVDQTSNAEIDIYNDTVNDYNSRCSNYRYHKPTLDSTQQEVDATRFSLQEEGKNRILVLR